VIAAVVLAAGASTRFGSQKLLAPVNDAPLVRRTVEQVVAAGLDAIVVVVGREERAVQAALEGMPVRFVANTKFREGMYTSLRAGIRHLARTAEAAIIVLGDQPGISAATITDLIEAYRASRQPIVVPIYNGVRGHPVLFDASVFPELETVVGDQGGREVIGRDPSRVASVHLPFAMPGDIDTIEDYRTLVGEGLTSPGGGEQLQRQPKTD
jgi:molybdenum cofactor cytidylyltransferase